MRELFLLYISELFLFYIKAIVRAVGRSYHTVNVDTAVRRLKRKHFKQA